MVHTASSSSKLAASARAEAEVETDVVAVPGSGTLIQFGEMKGMTYMQVLLNEPMYASTQMKLVQKMSVSSKRVGDKERGQASTYC